MGNEDKLKSLETELQQTKTELNKLKEGYDDFIHLASHDLQAPVRKITTLLDRFLQKTSDLPDESKIYLNRINNCLEQMTSLVTDIAKLSHVSKVPEDHQRESVNVTEIIDEIKSEEVNNNVMITTMNLPYVSANKEEIKKLFTELINNAIKFRNTESECEINISSNRLTEEEKIIYSLKAGTIYCNIAVHDNGIGFEQTLADKIFKPFQRLHGNSTYKGNGIGLAICKKIVENNGGVIYANGKEHGGATFNVILPEIKK